MNRATPFVQPPTPPPVPRKEVLLKELPMKEVLMSPVKTSTSVGSLITQVGYNLLFISHELYSFFGQQKCSVRLNMDYKIILQHLGTSLPLQMYLSVSFEMSSPSSTLMSHSGAFLKHGLLSFTR